ncbi:MAG: DnaK suppressor protein [Pseudohongiellaceae bacterium]|jgi:DnaK suppressor protein
MNKNDLERLKAQLIDLKASLLKQEDEHKQSSQPVELDQAKVGRLSRMDALQAQEMALETARRCQQQILNTNKALLRIALDDYGICMECDEDIDIRRLECDPACMHCIKCAEKLE